MIKAGFTRHARPDAAAANGPDLSTVELLPQTQTPLVAIDRKWCFPTPVTLHVEENPLTRKINVVCLDARKEPLLEIRRVDSTRGDLFHVMDVATQEHVLTVDGAPGAHFDIFPGLHERSTDTTIEREPGLLALAVTHTGSTLQFQDVELRRPSRAMLAGALRDRVALVSVHHGVSWQPIARINRPEHAFFKLPHSTLEIAAGVDITLPLVLWLGRWAVYELEQRIGARPTSGQWYGQPNPGTCR